MKQSFSVLSLTFVMPLMAQTPPPPRPSLPATLLNGTFEDGSLGQSPKGWFIPKPAQEAGFRCELAEDPSLPGKRCAVLFRVGSGNGSIANLMQNVDATPYRGKRIRLKGQLRLEAKEDSHATAQAWFRVDRAGEKRGFFDIMQDRPVRASTWTPIEIIGDVAIDAEQLALGTMLLQGEGKVWIASLSLEVLGETPVVKNEGPKALTPQGLKNLEAFTRALNYIRFFHPSDEVAQADWNRITREGVRAMEGATSTPDLAKRLHRFFAPYAPSAQFLVSGQHPKLTPTPPNAVFAVRWSHLGFGQKNSESHYQSTREFIPMAEHVGKGWADPHATTTLKLAGGISIWLPSVTFADAAKATLPKAATPPPAILTSTLPSPTGGDSASGDDRATRLGDVALAWGVFQHFYPYFDVIKTDWNAELPKALRTAALDKDAEAFIHTLRRLVAALKDGHGGVYGTESGGSSVPSLGLVMLDHNPVIGYSGGNAKVVPVGSRLLSVDDEPSETRLAKLKEEISAAGEGWMDFQLAQKLLEGGRDTKVKVGYRTATGTLGEATLTRDSNVWEIEAISKPEKLAELKPGVWYVDLDRISDKEFEAALPKLAQAKGVVFDLRGYPKTSRAFLQHLTNTPLESARWNMPIVTQPDGKGWAWNTSGRWNLEPKAPRIAGKVAFLTGGGAISYAESCMGIVEAYKLAEIVGEPTAGTNGNVNPFTLPGGYKIMWTGMKVLKHDGTPHHGVGIRPTVLVKPTAQGLSEGRDEVLEKGIEVVSH